MCFFLYQSMAKVSSALHWCFTINNPTGPLAFNAPMGYLVYQRETGESGTSHFQGYVRFEKRMYLTGIKKIVGFEGAHLEPMRGSPKQARDYCTKSDTRTEGPWEFGEFRLGQGSRTDLNSVAEAIVGGTPLQQVVDENPATYVRYHRGLQALEFHAQTKRAKELRALNCFVLVGPTGVGKTRIPFDVFGADRIYKLGTNTNGTLWFDGYNGEPVLLIDDFRGWIKYTELLVMLDIYPYRCQIKGGSTWALWTVVVITSNVDVSEWYHQTDVSPLTRRLFPTFFLPDDGDAASVIFASLL